MHPYKSDEVVCLYIPKCRNVSIKLKESIQMGSLRGLVSYRDKPARQNSNQLAREKNTWASNPKPYSLGSSVLRNRHLRKLRGFSPDSTCGTPIEVVRGTPIHSMDDIQFAWDRQVIEMSGYEPVVSTIYWLKTTFKTSTLSLTIMLVKWGEQWERKTSSSALKFHRMQTDISTTKLDSWNKNNTEKWPHITIVKINLPCSFWEIKNGKSWY